jgi:hypothetical protein
LSCKLFKNNKNNKGNNITSIGIICLKESLIKNKFLKKIFLGRFIDETNKLKNEFHLVYKLLKLTKNQLNLKFSKNIYFNSDDITLKLNFLKCFIDEIDHLFFNFHHFDLIILFI